MDKPQRKRIPLNQDRKPGSDGGDERAYTSNYGDPKPVHKSRAEGGFGENPESFFRKKEGGDSRSDRPGKPYGTRDFKAREGGSKKPYSGRPGSSEGGFERKDRKPFDRQQSGEGRPYGERKSFGDKKPYEKREGGEGRPYGERKSFGDRKPFEKREGGEGRPYGERKSFGNKKPYEKREGGEGRPYGDKKPFRNREDGDRKPYGDRKPFGSREGGERKSFGDRKPYGDRKPFSGGEKPSYGDRKPYGERKPFGDKKPFTPREGEERKPFSREEFSGNKRSFGDKKPFEKHSGDRKPYGSDRNEADREYAGKPRRRTFNDSEDTAPKAAESAEMTLNKYLAHSGISGRREAGELVKSGKVTVNKEVNTNPAYRVQPGDIVTYEGRVIKPEAAKVYVLLNKPKGFITTTEDEADRRTVMDLVQSVEAERLYPVGRLDRNTTGVLLITNDGDLAQRLTHPKYECKKIYQVTLDKDLTKADFDQILTGVALEDGEIKADALAYLETKNEIGIEIHSGRNRIVRRIFEHLGYAIEKLDRVMFAGLTKKNVPRGKYRLLTDKEVILLKHFKS